MPSATAAPDSVGPEATRTGRAAPRGGESRAGLVLTAGVAATLVFAVFVGRGGTDLGRATWVEIGLELLGTSFGAAAVVLAPPARRAWGVGALAALAGLTALTAASVLWSVEPSGSWVEANRTLAYLATFAGALALCRLAPARVDALVTGVLVACLAVCGYGVATKVAPGVLHASPLARLRDPFGYWNAFGLMAVLGVPGALWLGTRRAGAAWARPLAYPATGLLVVATLLSYSRGALLAGAIGAVVWVLAVPRRLRGLAVLGIGIAGGAAVSLWVFAQPALSEDNAPLAARENAGGSFGLLLLLMVAVLALAGVGVERVAGRRPLSSHARQRAGVAIVVTLALVPVGGAIGLAASHRGLGGSAAEAWHSLTRTDPSVSSGSPDRLTTVGNLRGGYWRVAWAVGSLHPWHGAGAGGFATAQARVSGNGLVVRHAHGYVVQTFADLGIPGLAISLLVLGALVVAVARATGRRRHIRTQGDERERGALWTLAAVVVVFGASSLVDWTWFVPGTALPALIAAGWLAGRGPPGERPAARRPAWRTPGRMVSAVAIVLGGLIAAYTTWQPLRSSRATEAALAAAATGDLPGAERRAAEAARIDPLAVDPLLAQATILDALGSRTGALAAYRDAVRRQPENPEPWLQLGSYEAGALRRPAAGLPALRRSLVLAPRSAEAVAALQKATAAAARP